MDTQEARFTTKPLGFVQSFHRVRPLNNEFVERLRVLIRETGYREQRPLCVTPDGVLWDGNHRFEALKAEGVEHAPMYVCTPASLTRAALESNEADANSLPQTFVDYAETIWTLLADQTQQQVADELGWSRSKVAQFARLQTLDSSAWSVVTDSVRSSLLRASEGVTDGVTAVTFSEFLLRDLIGLPADQQLELVTELADGTITKGKFKRRAQVYAHRNTLLEHVKEQLGEISPDLAAEATDAISRGMYDRNEADSEPVARLVASVRDRWAKKNAVTLRHGDFFEEVQAIGAGSVDLFVTDPPYNVSGSGRTIDLEGRSNMVLREFGEWDEHEHEDFKAMIAAIGVEYYRVTRDGGSGYVFVAAEYLSHLQESWAAAGFHIRNTLVWHKTNPGPQVIKTSFRSSLEYIVFVTKGEGHTFNWLGENEMHNFVEAPICGGHERLKDDRGETLHPTQKPLRVLRHLIEISSRPGDVVFDGFMGSGSTGHAAVEMGRTFSGIERDDRFFAAARRRLEGL